MSHPGSLFCFQKERKRDLPARQTGPPAGTSICTTYCSTWNVGGVAYLTPRDLAETDECNGKRPNVDATDCTIFL